MWSERVKESATHRFLFLRESLGASSVIETHYPYPLAVHPVRSSTYPPNIFFPKPISSESLVSFSPHQVSVTDIPFLLPNIILGGLGGHFPVLPVSWYLLHPSPLTPPHAHIGCHLSVSPHRHVPQGLARQWHPNLGPHPPSPTLHRTSALVRRAPPPISPPRQQQPDETQGDQVTLSSRSRREVAAHPL